LAWLGDFQAGHSLAAALSHGAGLIEVGDEEHECLGEVCGPRELVLSGAPNRPALDELWDVRKRSVAAVVLDVTVGGCSLRAN
jgi:hypothetical protein